MKLEWIDGYGENFVEIVYDDDKKYAGTVNDIMVALDENGEFHTCIYLLQDKRYIMRDGKFVCAEFWVERIKSLKILEFSTTRIKDGFLGWLRGKVRSGELENFEKFKKIKKQCASFLKYNFTPKEVLKYFSKDDLKKSGEYRIQEVFAEYEERDKWCIDSCTCVTREYYPYGAKVKIPGKKHIYTVSEVKALEQLKPIAYGLEILLNQPLTSKERNTDIYEFIEKI